MLTVAYVIEKLAEFSRWEDGESLSSIQDRLTPAQFAANCKLILSTSHRGNSVSYLRACVLQPDDVPLFDLLHRLPARLSANSLDDVLGEFRRFGYFDNAK